MIIRSLIFACLALASAAVSAQGFPSRPLRVIVPQPPGGGFDSAARVLSEPLATLLGQPVVVENRPGGGTIIGTEAAAKAEPDGYTLLLGASASPIHADERVIFGFDGSAGEQGVPAPWAFRRWSPVTGLGEYVAVARVARRDGVPVLCVKSARSGFLVGMNRAVDVTVIGVPFTSSQIMDGFRVGDTAWAREQVDRAVSLAEQTLANADASDSDRIAYAFRRCTARMPDPVEAEALARFLDKQRERIAAGELDAAAILGDDADVELAAWALTARVMLSLDETITRQ